MLAMAAVISATLLGCVFVLTDGAADYKVLCGKDQMVIRVAKDQPEDDIYIEGRRNFPGCLTDDGPLWSAFTIDYEGTSPCSANRVTNFEKKQVVYYHRLVARSKRKKETVVARCRRKILAKRDLLPASFEEAQELELEEITGRAAEPVVGMSILQDGKAIDAHLAVEPGTPLQMNIFLDSNSSDVYGIAAKYIDVSGARGQQEVILHEGCSVDKYLFENFKTVDGDVLTTVFRAFKFPESNYVLFRSTVSVCLDRCDPVDCGGGQSPAYRRRRSSSAALYEAVVTTVVRMKRSSGEQERDFPGYVVPVREGNHLPPARTTRNSEEKSPPEEEEDPSSGTRGAVRAAAYGFLLLLPLVGTHAFFLLAQ